MRVIFCLIILGISYCVGVKTLSGYKDRLLSLKDILNLIDKLKIEINFEQKKLNDIIFEFVKNCKTSIKNVINNEKCNILSKNEENLLKSMLKSLGKSDIEGQNLLLEKYKKQFENYVYDAEIKYREMSKCIIKLALCGGALLCILIW